MLPRLSHRDGLGTAEIDDLIDTLSIQAEIIDFSPAAEPALRDVNDQPVLGTLVAAIASSGADYLITGDKDLLAMADRYPIVAPAQFWAAHAGL